MTRMWLSSVLCLAAFATGCVQSLHPYYKEEQLTFDPALVGTWVDEDNATIVITAGDDQKSYQVVYTDKEKKAGKFDVHLAKVDDQLLLDITPAEPEHENESDMYQVHLLPVHSFMLLKKTDADTLAIRVMDYDWLKKHLESNPTAVAHEIVGGDRILLTAPSEKVQAFVLSHVKTPDAYKEPSTLKRAPAAATKASE